MKVVGACECGVATVADSDVETIDSGTIVRCSAGHEIVFDVWSPTSRAEFFHAARLHYPVKLNIEKKGEEQ